MNGDEHFVVCADGFMGSRSSKGEEVFVGSGRRCVGVVIGEGSFLRLQSPHLFRVYPRHSGTTLDDLLSAKTENYGP